MRRQVLYSGSKRTSGSARAARASTLSDGAQPVESRTLRERFLAIRNSRRLRYVGVVACLLLMAGVYHLWHERPGAFSQDDIDAAVLRTVESKTLPSRPAKAAELVRPSVVRVRGFGDPPKGVPRDKLKRPGHNLDPGAHDPPKGDSSLDKLVELGLGSGVVIVDDGTILTNLHVVAGVKRVFVTFYDGSESEALLLGAHPENDLAVIRALKIPDDLAAATLGSPSRLKPGDEVVAVGFPFGMGPSVSAGVVSGLNREFRSMDGKRVLSHLIQFDAAANPGSSGGPLITMQGDVVGIVTAILNPAEAGTFIGIGFAVTIGAAGNAVGIHPF